jgi:hypothetical protein
MVVLQDVISIPQDTVNGPFRYSCFHIDPRSKINYQTSFHLDIWHNTIKRPRTEHRLYINSAMRHKLNLVQALKPYMESHIQVTFTF